MNWIDGISAIKGILVTSDSPYVVNGQERGTFVDVVDHGTDYYVRHRGPSRKMFYGQWKPHADKGAYIEYVKHPNGFPEFVHYQSTSIKARWMFPRNGPESIEIIYMNDNKKLARCNFPNGLLLWWSFNIKKYSPLRTNFCATPLDEIAYLTMLDKAKTTRDLVDFFSDD